MASTHTLLLEKHIALPCLDLVSHSETPPGEFFDPLGMKNHIYIYSFLVRIPGGKGGGFPPL